MRDLFVKIEKLSKAINAVNGLRETKNSYNSINHIDIDKNEMPSSIFKSKDDNIIKILQFNTYSFVNDIFPYNDRLLYFILSKPPCFGYTNIRKKIKAKPNLVYKFKEDLCVFDLKYEDSKDLYLETA
jgi:hypothetical protein